MNKNFRFKIIALVTVLSVSSITFAGCSVAKAKNTDTGSSKNTTRTVSTSSNKKNIVQKSSTVNKKSNSPQANYYFSNVKVKLSKLVSARSITASQESAILDLFNKGKITTENFESQLNALAAKKTITNSQKLIIINTFKSNKISKALPIKKGISNK